MRNLFNYFFYYRPAAKEGFGGLKMRPLSYRKWRKFNKAMDFSIGNPNFVSPLDEWVLAHPEWESFYD